LGHARRACGRPKIQQDDFAAKICRTDLLSIAGCKLEIVTLAKSRHRQYFHPGGFQFPICRRDPHIAKTILGQFLDADKLDLIRGQRLEVQEIHPEIDIADAIGMLESKLEPLTGSTEPDGPPAEGFRQRAWCSPTQKQFMSADRI